MDRQPGLMLKIVECGNVGFVLNQPAGMNLEQVISARLQQIEKVAQKRPRINMAAAIFELNRPDSSLLKQARPTS
jgi:hypothetical protein